MRVPLEYSRSGDLRYRQQAVLFAEIPPGCCGNGGRLQFADIANGRLCRPRLLRDIDLWDG